jgi:serine phosphatase RsbU (regulator of sigma subunit)
MKQFFFSLAAFLYVYPLSAGAGFWQTLFGDGDHEFVCYSKIHRNYYLAIFGAVIIIALIAWNRYRLKKKNADLLEKKNQVIEEQNKDILDSIRYASRMQEAIRPPQEIIAGALPDSFFFLRPRDIVSGDFYFVDESDGKIVVAAIDCTGHGVPGAFLTFIGHNALRKAIETAGVKDPSRLLDLMNTEVKNTLGQQRSQNELNDGMEVGLCIYDRETRMLEYAGAGTPLSIFRDGKLEEIKPAKCTVGSVQEHVKEPPPTHRIELLPGDTFYLGSDGIADQFGGPEGKKFRREQLRKVIADMQPLKMPDQAKFIDQTLSDWMKGHAQTDDMLLIGVRV